MMLEISTKGLGRGDKRWSYAIRDLGRTMRSTANSGAQWRWSMLGFVIALSLVFVPAAHASFIGAYAFGQWTLTNSSADGSVIPTVDGIQITGGNTGSGDFGTTDFTAIAAGTGLVSFSWSYFSLDIPTFDYAGYLLSNAFSFLADTSGEAGNQSFSVVTGQEFGFQVATIDNEYEPGILSISDFSAPQDTGTSGVPEPGTAPMTLLAVAAAGAILCPTGRKKLARKAGCTARPSHSYLAALFVGLLAASLLPAQVQFHYTGANATGQLALTGSVNLSQLAQQTQMQTSVRLQGAATKGGPDWNRNAPSKLLHPPVKSRRLLGAALLGATSTSDPLMQSMSVSQSTTALLHFAGLTHYDQRNANGGSQFSVEPPSQGLAEGNGYIVEGVNNAIQIYNLAGMPLLPVVLATNQVFGMAPAINWTTGIEGPYPTDIRVFWDSDIRRWFILQRVADNDASGDVVFQSQIYLAVSQTDIPTGVFNIYVIDTTNASRPGCPCVSDYPQIGADQYGLYISSNEFDFYSNFWDVSILAISKAGLAAGLPAPTTVEFVVPPGPGYEFTIQPATTPPGASYLTANGGLEYFVSAQANLSSDNNLAVWAMTNTISLTSANPILALSEAVIPTLTYISPPTAGQRPGPLPYGSTLGFTTPVPLDGGDLRVLSVCYTGGRLYVTLPTQVEDAQANVLVGGAFVVISPSYRSGTLTGSALRQGYLMVAQNNLLRPAIAVDSQGRGAIVFTLVGPVNYPSAAFVPFSSFAPANTVQIAGPGLSPEDGFTGYDYPYIARWGDYSAAVVGDNGNIYMGTEYVPVGPLGQRTEYANWGTFLIGIPPQ
jgi:hypothetical protein